MDTPASLSLHVPMSSPYFHPGKRISFACVRKRKVVEGRTRSAAAVAVTKEIGAIAQFAKWGTGEKMAGHGPRESSPGPSNLLLGQLLPTFADIRHADIPTDRPTNRHSDIPIPTCPPYVRLGLRYVGFRRVRFEDIEGTMSAFRALRHLVISNEIDLRDSNPPSTPNTSPNNQFRALELPRQTHWFSLLLSSISSPLSHLTFPVITLDSEKQLELVDWGAINDLLCGSCMREVVIKVNIGDNPISSEHIESDIRQRLSEGLRKGTRLIVEVWKYSLETAKE
ncbi:hypothetical protein DFP72DRAFT_1110709 [Ephemerocybe angulata]|uniref:Uncharacterized protein n=1 Tax=Ephemerocybe angulata TaxID=980116 RepID=A0A8H6I4N3_9AGAR|nr:hypothetical protein DFP72DRAFT_1110709 [Tulosesus angulatus]